MRKKGIYIVVAAVLLLILAGIVMHHFRTQASDNTYENKKYSVSYPSRVTVEVESEQEIAFYTQEQVGGVAYYPLSDWDAFCTWSSSGADEDRESIAVFLKGQGILPEDGTIDAYMFDLGTRDGSATLWERNADGERDHFFVFTKEGHCYDLWFDGNGLSSEEKDKMVDSFTVKDRMPNRVS